MKMIKAPFLIICVIAISACSNRHIYDAVQHNNELECGKLPQAQYEQCMEEISQSYEEYQRDREELSES
jgi:hypothetical protein